MTTTLRATIVALLLLCAAASSRAGAAEVKLARVPDGGLQPQVVIAADKTVHLIYLTGKPNAAAINYVCSSDGGGGAWSRPLIVSGDTSPAIAVGTIRGPHLAVGSNGTIHVAWMASPKAMMYARLPRGAKRFEPPRNLVTAHAGLDGGGSVAADGHGHVFVAWHAPATKPDGDEASRRVYLTTSSDDGRTFSAERAIFDRPTGACGCCGMRLFAARDRLFCSYRGAMESTHRGLFLLGSRDNGQSFTGVEFAPMELGICLMSTNAFAAAGDDALVAWETLGKISWGRIDSATGTSAERAIPAPGESKSQKHPALAISPAGEVLLAWTEGTKFGKGGSLARQVYDSTGASSGHVGRADGVPAHSLPAAFCNEQGDFIILY
jgi:hypothetical protein